MEKNRKSLLRRGLQAVGAAIVVSAMLLIAGCDYLQPDKNAPIIQSYSIAGMQGNEDKWMVEGENADIKVDASDNRGIRKAYVQLDNGVIIPLTKTEGKEVEWKADYNNMPIGLHAFNIVVEDGSNQTIKEGTINVYPNDADEDGLDYRTEVRLGTDPDKKNPVTKYLLDKNLELYIPVLGYLENDEVMDSNEKSFIDMVGQHTNLDSIYPGFIAEVVKLPDLSESGIDQNDVKRIAKLFEIAERPEYKKAFERILDEGVRGSIDPPAPGSGRQVNTPLEILYKGIVFSAFDANNPLVNYSAVNMWNWFTTTPEWKDYQKNLRTDFDFATSRLITPELIGKFMKDYIKFTPEPPGVNINQQAIVTFNQEYGDCEDHAMFALYCLMNNGYMYDDSFEDNQNDVACILDVQWGHIGEKVADGHAVCVYKKDDIFYYIDSNNFYVGAIEGPCYSIEDVAKKIHGGWKLYQICNSSMISTKRTRR